MRRSLPRRGRPSRGTEAGVGDFNGDGTSDLLWDDQAGGEAEVWQLHDARLAARVDLGSHPADWRVAAVGDFDGNDVSDVMWRDASGQMTSWLLDAPRLLSANDFLFA